MLIFRAQYTSEFLEFLWGIEVSTLFHHQKRASMEPSAETTLLKVSNKYLMMLIIFLPQAEGLSPTEE